MALAVIPIHFNSCSPKHYDGDYAGVLSKVDTGPCSMAPTFEKEFHSFLKSNCATCHIPGGQGKGAIAASDPLVAWEAFSLVGAETVSQYATNPSHNYPYTGTQHQETIDAALNNWSSAKTESDNCLAQENGEQAGIDLNSYIHFKSKPINASFELDNSGAGDSKTLTWDLSKDSLTAEFDATQVEGVTFSVDIRAKEFQGNRFYEIFNPRVNIDSYNPSYDKDAAKLYAINFKSLKIKRNGNFILNESTFTYVDKTVRKFASASEAPENENQLSTGTMIAVGDISTADVLSVSFGEINITEAYPPPPPIEVSFKTASTDTTEGSQAQVTLQLKAQGRNLMLDPIEAPISVTVKIVETSGKTLATPVAYQENPKVIDDRDGVSVTVNNFDWDYKEDKRTVIFLPPDLNETPVIEKTLNFDILDDDRFEGEVENIIVEIEESGVSNAIPVITPNASNGYDTHEIRIATSDPGEYVDPFDTNTQTFTKLMSPGGVLHDNCLGCHNNARSNGFDLTNYQGMIDSRVLIPGDQNSKMYQRMNPESGSGLAPMPLGGYLSDERERKKVETWILDGAKNN